MTAGGSTLTSRGGSVRCLVAATYKQARPIRVQQVNTTQLLSALAGAVRGGKVRVAVAFGTMRGVSLSVAHGASGF